MSQESGESSNEEYEESPAATPDVEFFPQPVDEFQQTVLTVKYLGSRPVDKSSGIDVLNEAISNVLLDIELSKDALTAGATDEEKRDEKSLLDRESRHVNKDCRIRITPANVVIETMTGQTLVEVRVRFISFMAICRSSIKRCGFIVQTPEDQFVAHCFECEPDAGDLCKALESACQIRYQKCLDGHTSRRTSGRQSGTTTPSSSGLFVNKILSKIIGK